MNAACAVPAAVTIGVVAAITVTSPAAPAPGAGRPAATPACGATCANYFVQEFARKFVLNDFRSHTSGTKVLLYPRSNANRDKLTTTRLHQFSDGTVYDDQMWINTLGVLP